MGWNLAEIVDYERMRCAGSGFHEHDGCSCSDFELIRRGRDDDVARAAAEERAVRIDLEARLAASEAARGAAEQRRDGYEADSLRLFREKMDHYHERLKFELALQALQCAVFGGEPDDSLPAENFVEMAATLHAAREGAVARAEKAEAALAEAREPVAWRITDPAHGVDRATLSRADADYQRGFAGVTVTPLALTTTAPGDGT